VGLSDSDREKFLSEALKKKYMTRDEVKGKEHIEKITEIAEVFAKEMLPRKKSSDISNDLSAERSTGL